MSREKKWTPGPWKVEVGDDEVFPGMVFVVHDETVCDETTICVAGYGEHDAALISAAPELLEALEKLERTAYLGIQHHLERCTCSLCQDFLSVKAALAKAYGETA